MKTVMTTTFDTNINEHQLNDFERIEYLAKAGFGGFNFGMEEMHNENSPFASKDYLKYIKEVNKVAQDYNFPCLLAHSIFYPVKEKSEVLKILDEHKRCIEMASILKAPIIVVHPVARYSPEQNYEEIYSVLLPLAKSANIKIAAENMYLHDKLNGGTFPAACGNAEDFCKTIDLANSNYMTGCLDIGHSYMPKAPGAPQMIKALGNKRLKCIHVHDNDLINDSHTIPFQRNCKINWDEVICALKEIKYDGDFTFESTTMTARYPLELVPSALRHLSEIGNYFIKKIKE